MNIRPIISSEASVSSESTVRSKAHLGSVRLFHERIFARTPVYGRIIKNYLCSRATHILEKTEMVTDPDISVVIRTKNDITSIEQLITEIRAQEFNGKIEILLVDTESTDGTRECAAALGAKIIPITQADFSYPKALNLGFAAARYPYVVTLVGHSRLASNAMLRSLAYWQRQEARLGGIYGLNLPNDNATWAERIGAIMLKLPKLMRNSEKVSDTATLGLLAANCAVVNKHAWQELGGFDEAFGAGGEDSELGRTMIKRGWTVVREPAFSVHHTHGTGLLKSYKQWRYWHNLEKGRPFDHRRLLRFRSDLRAKER